MTDDTKRAAGRPLGSGEERRVTFRLRLTEEERKCLDKLAEEAMLTPSQYVRRRIFGNPAE